MRPFEILGNNQMNNLTIPKRKYARTYLNYIIFTLNNHVGKIGDQKLNEAGVGEEGDQYVIVAFTFLFPCQIELIMPCCEGHFCACSWTRLWAPKGQGPCVTFQRTSRQPR